MGIKDLKKIILDYAKNSIREISLKEFYGNTLGIDASIYLYRFSYMNGNVCNSFVLQCLRLLKNGILPLYVFDGKPPKEKDGELIERTQHKRELSIKKNIVGNILSYLGVGNISINVDINVQIQLQTQLQKDFNMDNDKILIDKYFDFYKNFTKEQLNKELNYLSNSLIQISQQTRDNVKHVLDLLGIPYINAVGEADIVLAKLNKDNITIGSLSEDMDILTYGGTKLFRGYTNSANWIEEYDLYKLLYELGITYNSFVDMCIMCGCDYTKPIVGIGYVNAYNYIKTEINIENIIKKYCEVIEEEDNKKKYIKIGTKGQATECNYMEARKIFNIDIGKLDINVKLEKPQIKELIEFLGMNEKNQIKMQKSLQKIMQMPIYKKFYNS